MRESWIKEKLVDKKFKWTDHLKALYANDEKALQQALYDAVHRDQPQSALRYLVLGASQRCCQSNNEEEEVTNMTPLMKATEIDSATMVELLLHWGATLDERDSQGWTALHYAVQQNNVGYSFFYISLKLRSGFLNIEKALFDFSETRRIDFGCAGRRC